MSDEIKVATLDDLFLDPKNPRLGRRNTAASLSQEQVLDCMRTWSLEELAVSFLESGFWSQEALLCVNEKVAGSKKLVVVEGNRRLAALKLLHQSIAGNPPSPNWAKMLEDKNAPKHLFDRIPYILMSGREEIEFFLGYRHVTGIKEWAPAEKAEYIAHLIDNRGLSYQEVMRKIGSKTEAVRRNYIAYRLLRQMEDIDGIDVKSVEDKFSVLFLSIRAPGSREFLGLNMKAEPDEARTPVSDEHIENLKDYTRWLFGTEEEPPLVEDSRRVDEFARVLASQEGVKYLRTAKRPLLAVAYQKAGGEEDEILELLEAAAFNIEQALSTLHLHKKSERLQKAIDRLVADIERAQEVLPHDKKK